jgi:hypothetical protein
MDSTKQWRIDNAKRLQGLTLQLRPYTLWSRTGTTITAQLVGRGFPSPALQKSCEKATRPALIIQRALARSGCASNASPTSRRK